MATSKAAAATATPVKPIRRAGTTATLPPPAAAQAQPAAAASAPVTPAEGDGWSFAALGKWILNTAGVEAPGWTRGLITFGVVVLLGVGVAMAGSALTAFLAAGAISMGIGSFVSWIISLCAWALVIYFGGGLCVKLAKYFLTKAIDRDVAYVRDNVVYAVTPSGPKYVVLPTGEVATRQAPQRAAA